MQREAIMVFRPFTENRITTVQQVAGRTIITVITGFLGRRAKIWIDRKLVMISRTRIKTMPPGENRPRHVEFRSRQHKVGRSLDMNIFATAITLTVLTVLAVVSRIIIDIIFSIVGVVSGGGCCCRPPDPDDTTDCGGGRSRGSLIDHESVSS